MAVCIGRVFGPSDVYLKKIDRCIGRVFGPPYPAHLPGGEGGESSDLPSHPAPPVSRGEVGRVSSDPAHDTPHGYYLSPPKEGPS